MRLFLGNRAVTVRATQAIGKGGEADVYDLGSAQALKVFKTRRHPDLAGDAVAQQAAEDRLALHQRKLPDFPSHLPERVVAPVELARDKPAGRVLGYRMRLVRDATPLCAFADPTARMTGLGEAQTRAVLLDLHGTITALHRRGVVIGDLNDLNVLVRGEQAHLIDADSFQFGAYPCPVFSLRFADPRLLVEVGGALTLGTPHDPNSDWYAFAVLLMQSLLFVDPYGGIYRPRHGPRLGEEKRPLERITVFHPEVRYPKPARPLAALPDALLHRLEEVFVRDRRGPFDPGLLQALRFTACTSCGLTHARQHCPRCQTAPVSPQQTITVRGQVTATRIFASPGRILTWAVSDGQLRWLVHENGAFKREDGREVMCGELDASLDFALQDQTTLVAQRGRVVALGKSASPPPETFAAEVVAGSIALAANSRHRYWAFAGQLWRDGAYGPERLGELLAGQTRIFAGERFGVGFYRAAELCVGFVFDAERAGLADRLVLPPIRGELYGMACVFAHERAWLMWQRQENGRRLNACAVIRADGLVEASYEEPAGKGPLARLGGQAAVGRSLFAATDEGIVELELDGNRIHERRRFPDTESFVDSHSRLLLCREGLAVASSQEICVLRIGDAQPERSRA